MITFIINNTCFSLNRRLQDDITKGLRNLNELAKKLNKKRIENGAITLSSPEVRFQLDFDSQDPVDIGIIIIVVIIIKFICLFIYIKNTNFLFIYILEMKELIETNALVEEFMLLANISVAKKIISKFPASSLLRYIYLHLLIYLD